MRVLRKIGKMELSDISVYAYVPSRGEGSVDCTLYCDAGPNLGDNLERTLEGIIKKSLNENPPKTNPFTVSRFGEAHLLIIYKHQTNDKLGRTVNSANILCLSTDMFRIRGFNYLSLFPLAENPARIAENSIASIGDKTRQALRKHTAETWLPWLASAAELLTAKNFISIKYSLDQREKIHSYVTAAFALVPPDCIPPYLETTRGDSCEIQIGEAGFLSKRHDLDPFSGIGSTKSEFYGSMLVALQKNIFSNDELKSINLFYTAAQHFGRGKFLPFINQYDNIKNKFFGAIKCAADTGLFFQDATPTLALCHKIAIAQDELKTIEFIRNYENIENLLYKNLQYALEKSLLSDEKEKTITTYYKLAQTFGDSALINFLQQNNAASHELNLDIFATGYSALLKSRQASVLRQSLVAALGKDDVKLFLLSCDTVKSPLHNAIDFANRNGLFFKNTFKTTHLCHNLANFFGQAPTMAFIHNYQNIKPHIYNSIVTAMNAKIFSEDQYKSYEICHKFAKNFGRDEFRAFVVNYHSFKHPIHECIVDATKNGLLSGDAMRAAESVYKMIDAFGEKNTLDFIYSNLRRN